MRNTDAESRYAWSRRCWVVDFNLVNMISIMIYMNHGREEPKSGTKKVKKKKQKKSEKGAVVAWSAQTAFGIALCCASGQMMRASAFALVRSCRLGASLRRAQRPAASLRPFVSLGRSAESCLLPSRIQRLGSGGIAGTSLSATARTFWVSWMLAYL